MTKFVSKEIERELMSSTIFRALLTPMFFFNSQFTHTQPKSIRNKKYTQQKIYLDIITYKC